MTATTFDCDAPLAGPPGNDGVPAAEPPQTTVRSWANRQFLAGHTGGRQMAPSGMIQRVSDLQGRATWLVSGHETVRELLADPRLGRSHPNPGHPVRLTQPGLFGGPIPDPAGELADLHRMRKLLTPALSASRMENLRPRVEMIVDELLSELGRSGPPADFHTMVAFPLPALVVCELLGVPTEDRPGFCRWQLEAKQVSKPAVARGGLQSLWRYLGTLIERRRWVAGDDIISELLHAAELDPELTDDGIAHLAAGLLFAGHAPVVAIIDRGMLLLLTHSGQRDMLQREPSLAAPAVEEIFRFASPIERIRAARRGGLTRHASTDIKVGNVTIHAGDTVMFAVQEANEDGSVFTEPKRFDITRARNPHLSLSHGAHFCLGAHLARMTLQYLFGHVFEKFPALELAVPVDEIIPVREAVAGAVDQLPVTW